MPEPAYPALPIYHATWTPVYLEPISGSGERITVALAAVDADGVGHVQPTLRQDTVKCFLGDQAPQLIRLADGCVESLVAHFASKQPLSAWRPPLGGVVLGDPVETYAPDLAAVFRMAVRSSAFLATLPELYGTTATPTEEVDHFSAQGWVREVQKTISQERPELVEFFGRKLKVGHHGRPTRFDFAGRHLVAQMGRIFPGRGLAHNVRSAKVKLWDIESLRTLSDAPRLFESRQPRYELILLRPHHDDPLYTDRETRALNESLAELEEAGDKHELRVRPVFTTRAAVNEILNAEAA
jgi:hypothetical protein